MNYSKDQTARYYGFHDWWDYVSSLESNKRRAKERVREANRPRHEAMLAHVTGTAIAAVLIICAFALYVIWRLFL